MARRKKELGRPTQALLPRMDATPQELAKAMFALRANHEWKYLGKGPPAYQCQACGETVSYPNVLTRAGLYADCARG